MRRFLLPFLTLAALLVAAPAATQWQCSPEGYTPTCRGSGTGFTSKLTRTKLTSTLNTYVNPSTGVDTSVDDTLVQCTQAAPCLTITRAFQEVEKYDLSDFPARINLANGTYTESTRVTQSAVGAGGVVITGPIDGSGNCIDRDLVLIRPTAGTGHGFGIAIQGREVTLQCMNISTALTPATGAMGVAFHGGVIGIIKNITFGDAEAGHVSCAEGARCTFTGDYSVNGYAAYHLRVAEQALVFHIARTVTYATPTSFSITNITQANPAVVTAAGHNFVNGNIIRIKSVAGMTEVNGQTYTVANATATTFELSGTNSSGYGAYTSGGSTYRPYHHSLGFINVERGGGMSLTANAYSPAAPSTSTVTVTSASPGVVTWTGHGRSVNDPITFSVGDGDTLPTGINAGTIYYVKSILSVDTFTISSIPGGNEVNTDSIGMGTITAALEPDITGRKFYVASGGWITPGFAPNVTPSVPQELPGTSSGQIESGGVYYTSGSNIGPVSSVAAGSTVNVGIQPNTEIRVTGASTSISSLGSNDDSAIGMYRFLNFDNAQTFFNNNPVSKSYILTPDGNTMFVYPGDRVFAVFVGGGVWRVYWIGRAQLPPGANYIVNPAFSAWQAGTTFAINAATFTADRWSSQRGIAGVTVSRATGFSGAEYSMQIQRDAGANTTNGINVAHQVETEVAQHLAGKVVAVHCAYQTGANYSPSTYPSLFIYTGTGANEAYSHTAPGFTTNNTASSNLGTIIAPLAVSTTGTLQFQKYTVPSTTAGSPVVQFALRFVISPTGATAGADDWIRITNCKLEIDAFTPFVPPSKAAVLAEVQRRYQKSFNDATTPAQNVGTGTGEVRFPAVDRHAATASIPVGFRQKMRLGPTGALPTITLYNPSAANANARDITLGQDCTSPVTSANDSESGFTVTCTQNITTSGGRKRWRTVELLPLSNSTSVTALGTAATVDGTATAQAVASTNAMTQTLRIRYVSAAGAGSSAGPRGNANAFWRGNAAGLGGFYFQAKVGWEVFQTDARMFVGLYAATVSIGNVDPNTLLNMVGVGCNTTQTTLRVMHNDGAGAATEVDLGANYPCNTSATDLYEVELWAAPNDSVIYYRVTRLGTANVATGSLSSNLPANTSFMNYHIWGNNAATAAAVELSLSQLYIESPIVSDTRSELAVHWTADSRM